MSHNRKSMRLAINSTVDSFHENGLHSPHSQILGAGDLGWHPRTSSSASSRVTMTDAAIASLRTRYVKAGQEHVLPYISSNLTDGELAALLKQLSDIPVETLEAILAAAKQQESSSAKAQTIEPFLGMTGNTADAAAKEAARIVGLEAIRKQKVAALVLAGGQGTRLGFDGPKGMYDIGLPSGRTLFQLLAERLRKLRDMTGAYSLPLYVMTSPVNHQMTTEHFQRNDYFGLGVENVFFFQQGMLPCLTEDGKIIMETPTSVSMAPDGNGGVYTSLKSSGAIDDMMARGVEFLHVFSIDNALVRPADPVFLGYCIGQGADCGNKVVWKLDPDEKVGVVAMQDGKPCIIEYSELTTEMASQRDSSGKLLYGAGNICNHFFTLDFIQAIVLPNFAELNHVARKKIPYWDGNKTVTPSTANGIKLETFIFDVFPLSKKMAVWEVARHEEFAPVKNAAGAPSDSPDTARALISDIAKMWLRQAGAILEGEDTATCEISPTISYDGEGLEVYAGERLLCPFSL